MGNKKNREWTEAKKEMEEIIKEWNHNSKEYNEEEKEEIQDLNWMMNVIELTDKKDGAIKLFDESDKQEFQKQLKHQKINKTEVIKQAKKNKKRKQN